MTLVGAAGVAFAGTGESTGERVVLPSPLAQPMAGESVPAGSSPLLAALEANAKQATGHALGFVNPALYKLAGTGALHDILDPAVPAISVGPRYCQGDAESEPCLTTYGRDLGLAVRPGYDEVTGLGTPAGSFVTAFRKL
jgi:subtilase family serine protease